MTPVYCVAWMMVFLRSLGIIMQLPVIAGRSLPIMVRVGLGAPGDDGVDGLAAELGLVEDVQRPLAGLAARGRRCWRRSRTICRRRSPA